MGKAITLSFYPLPGLLEVGGGQRGWRRVRRAERGGLFRDGRRLHFKQDQVFVLESPRVESTPFVPLPSLVLVAKDPRLFRSLLVVYHPCYLDEVVIPRYRQSVRLTSFADENIEFRK